MAKKKDYQEVIDRLVARQHQIQRLESRIVMLESLLMRALKNWGKQNNPRRSPAFAEIKAVLKGGE